MTDPPFPPNARANVCCPNAPNSVLAVFKSPLSAQEDPSHFSVSPASPPSFVWKVKLASWRAEFVLSLTAFIAAPIESASVSDEQSNAIPANAFWTLELFFNLSFI